MLDFVKDKVEDIISLLENVGYFLLNEQRRHSYTCYKKSDGSLFTDLDIASEVMIKNELNGLFGDVKVLSEENPEDENKEIVKYNFFFLLDPIDGTTNFIKGGDFTINLSLCHDKHPCYSFIHNPIKRSLIFGEENQSFIKRNDKITKLSKLQEKDRYDTIIHNKEDMLKVAIGKNNFHNKDYVNLLVEEVQKCGYYFSKYNLKSASAMGKLLMLIDKEIDCFITSYCCKNWDVLPAIPILKSINAYNNMKDCYVFENNSFHSGSLIATNSEDLLHDLMDIENKLRNING